MIKKSFVVSVCISLFATVGFAEEYSSTMKPETAPVSAVKSMALVAAEQVPTNIILYQDYAPWQNRVVASFLAAGLVDGTDFSIRPTTDIVNGVPAETKVVWLGSNAWWNTYLNVNTPEAQSVLDAFVRRGGVLVGGLADNADVSFLLPGLTGSTTTEYPVLQSAIWTNAAKGEDALLGTSDDHLLVLGSNGLGGGDDLNNSDLSIGYLFFAHGYLDSLGLPGNTKYLMTSSFASGEKSVLAEYCLGEGLVIPTTVTLEFYGQVPEGIGQTNLVRNLLDYVTHNPQATACSLHPRIDIKPGANPNSINLSSSGVVPVAIYGDVNTDVTKIDPSSVTLAGAKVKMVGKSNKLLAHYEDLNGDGFMDLVCQVETLQWIIQPGATTARLDATTYSGRPVVGEDSIEIVE